MFRYVARRLIGLVPILLGVTLIVFLMLYLVPGDPILLLYRQVDNIQEVPPARLQSLRREFGLDKPLMMQYLSFVAKAVRGDFGKSITLQGRVIDIIKSELPFTIELGLAALIFAVVFGILTGIVAAVKRGTLIDTFTMVAATWGLAMPTFWFGLMAIIIFSVYLGWFPTSGEGSFSHLVLPAVTLGVFSAALIARLTRSSLLETLHEDFVRTARAKGLPESSIVYRHALRNALIPVVTVVGLQFGSLLAGAVITETVFARRGLGRLMVEAILGKDFPLVQTLVLLSAVTYVMVNLTVDLFYVVIDPRITYD
ncbi:MAG TPA: ABC transporter permease [bacterium]|nr:ABC transporter permease [bacterium]